MDNKKVTGKLEAEELEKRKAPFASPIVNREGEGRTGSGGTESTGRTVPGGPVDPPPPEPSLPKPPIVHRTN